MRRGLFPKLPVLHVDVQSPPVVFADNLLSAIASLAVESCVSTRLLAVTQPNPATGESPLDLALPYCVEVSAECFEILIKLLERVRGLNPFMD